MHWVRHFQELTQKASGLFISGSIQHLYKINKQPLLLQIKQTCKLPALTLTCWTQVKPQQQGLEFGEGLL